MNSLVRGGRWQRARVRDSMAVKTTVQVTMPAMGESVTEGTVLEWHKKEGDPVDLDEVLVEISTDKVDAEVPSPTAGTVVKVHAAEGDAVEVGELLCEIESGEAPTPAATEPEAMPESSGNGAPTSTGEIVDIVTPAGGESVTEGTILEWAVKVGDTVADGDTVVEISTDKVDMELPAPTAGTITEIVAEEGETVTGGQVIARLQVGAGAGAPAATNGAGGASPGAGGVSSPAGTKDGPAVAN